MNKNDRVVYVHFRHDDGLPFYVGMGSTTRPFEFHGRNKFWHNVKNKHGVDVKIVAENLTRDEAFELERKLISEYRSKFNTLTNITDGGEGAHGINGTLNPNFKHFTVLVSGKFVLCFTSSNLMEEHGFSIKQIYNTKYKTITSNRYYIDDVKIRFEIIRTDNYQDVETILDNGIAPEINEPKTFKNTNKNHHSFGTTLTVEHKRKLKIASTGKIHTELAKKKISNAQIGSKNHAFKGFTIGINSTHFIIAMGSKEITKFGFNQGLVSQCILGRKPSHKNFTWFRSEKINKEIFKNLSPFNSVSMARLHGFSCCISKIFVSEFQ